MAFNKTRTSAETVRNEIMDILYQEYYDKAFETWCDRRRLDKDIMLKWLNQQEAED